MPRRLTVLFASVALFAAGAGWGSSRIVHRGAVATIAVATGSEAACLAVVHYADGGIQAGGVRYASGGRVAWRIRVPPRARLGRAHWGVSCGVTRSWSGSFLVVR